MDPNELRKLAAPMTHYQAARAIPSMQEALRKAADEIERLRADHEAAMVEACEERCAKNRALAEVERLREALQDYAEVANYERGYNSDPETHPIWVLHDCGAQARAALTGKEDL